MSLDALANSMLGTGTPALLAAALVGMTALACGLSYLWQRTRLRLIASANANLLLANRLSTAEQEVARMAAEMAAAQHQLTQARIGAGSMEAVERQLHALFDSISVPLWLRDGQGRLIRINKAYASALGETSEQILAGQREFAPAALAQQAKALGLGVAVAGKDRASEKRTLVIDGARHVFEVVEQRLGEQLTGGYAIEQTELESTKAELARHVSAHEETLEQLGSAIAIYDAQQRMVFYNQAYMRLWQFDEAFLKSGPSYSDVVENMRERRKLPEERDFPRYKRERQALFTSLLEPREDLQHLPDGSTYRVLAIPHPLGGLMFVTEDITDKLALETSYNTLIAVQRETLDNLAEGIIVFGADGRHRLHNPAWTRIWNVEEHILEANPHISDLLESMRPLLDDGSDWTAIRNQMIQNSFVREPLYGRMVRVDGSVIEYRSTPLPDGAILYSDTDVTDSARVETALRTTNQALAEADRLKSEFVANVSYQLRTPLSTIIGFAEILTNQYFGPLNDRQMEYGRTILEASRRLLSLINAVLDLATIEAGRMQLNRRPLDVAAMLQGAADMVQDAAKRQNLRLLVEVAPDIGMAPLDERKMQQVLFNLLANALQYTPPGGKITLVAEKRTDTLLITVSDTGIGIAEADQERIFDKFERTNPQARQAGVGLGLALVRSFVELHGGKVELTSNMNEGTRITCIMPLILEDEEGSAAA